MVVERLFLAVPQGCLQFVIVVFPDHTHLLFMIFQEKHHSHEISHLIFFENKKDVSSAAVVIGTLSNRIISCMRMKNIFTPFEWGSVLFFRLHIEMNLFKMRSFVPIRLYLSNTSHKP